MRLRGENFLSIGKIDIVIPKGVTLIRGFNHDDGTEEGAGKSAVPSFIFWILTGEMPKDVNIDDVIKEGEKTCKGLLDLDDFSVFRSRSPNDLHIKEKDGKIWRGRDATETLKEIIKRLGMSFKTICQAVYFAQNYPNKFVTANQEKKGQILTEILNLEQFDRAGKRALDRMKPLKEELIEVDKNVLSWKVKLEGESKNIESFKQLIKEFEKEKVEKIKKLISDHEKIQAEAQSFEVEFRATQKETIDRGQEEIKKLKRHIKVLEEKRTGLEKLAASNVDFPSAIKELEAHQKTIQTDMNGAKIKIATLELHNKAQAKREKILADHETELESIDLEIEKIAQAQIEANSYAGECAEAVSRAKTALANPSKEECPTCGQPWSGDLEHYKKEVGKAQSALERADKRLIELKERRMSAKGRKAPLLEEISALKAEIDQFVPQDPEALRASVQKSSEALKELEEALINVREKESEVKEARSAIKLVDSAIENQEEQINRLERDIEATREGSPDAQLAKFGSRMEKLVLEIEAEDQREPDSLRSKLRIVQEAYGKAVAEWESASCSADSIRVHLARLDALRDGFKEVKAYTFENALRLLNSKANQYMVQLFNQKVKIKFKNEDLKIETLVEIEGKERSLSLCSGGQFRRIALSVDLALSDVTMGRKGNRLNLLVLDEYFKDLSTTSMKRVLKILQARKTPTLLIEHNDLFKQIVNQTINVELRNGTSSVTM